MPGIIRIENPNSNPTLREINIIKREMKSLKEGLTKQYLEGKLYVLNELYKNGIMIPKSLRSNYE